MARPWVKLGLPWALVVLAGLATGVGWRLLQRETPRPPSLAWHFVYVMPYDNDLDRCAGPITQALRRGARHPSVAVSVLYDGVAQDGLRELSFRGREERSRRIDTEDGADAAQVASFLDRVTRDRPARRYVLVFLDHGGAMDQLGYDERPARADGGSAPRWLSARGVGEALRRWRSRRQLAGEAVPLVFLQQCGRASIETLVNFRRTGERLLASQRDLGACNTYYEALLAFASAHPDATGRDLAEVIFEADRNSRSLTLVRTQALEGIVPRVDAFAREVLSGGRTPGPSSVAGIAPCFSFGISQNYDLLQVVRAVATASGGRAPLLAEALERFVQEDLVERHHRRSDDLESAGWCGVSTHLPALAGLLDLYSLQPLYQETRWGELARALSANEGLTIRASPPTRP
ncbi:MAG: hypothetical protein HY909_13490 [Deltaproteobacteria bacterium]|nr:hypothetical protein [Deltaproteobacteria bacterium]